MALADVATTTETITKQLRANADACEVLAHQIAVASGQPLGTNHSSKIDAVIPSWEVECVMCSKTLIESVSNGWKVKVGVYSDANAEKIECYRLQSEILGNIQNTIEGATDANCYSRIDAFNDLKNQQDWTASCKPANIKTSHWSSIGRIKAVAVNTTNTLMLVCTDYNVCLCDVPNLKVLKWVTAESSALVSIDSLACFPVFSYACFVPGDQSFMIADSASSHVFEHAISGKELRRLDLRHFIARVWGVDTSVDLIACTHNDGFHMLDYGSGKVRRSISRPGAHCRGVRFSPGDAPQFIAVAEMKTDAVTLFSIEGVLVKVFFVVQAIDVCFLDATTVMVLGQSDPRGARILSLTTNVLMGAYKSDLCHATVIVSQNEKVYLIDGEAASCSMFDLQAN